MTDHFGPFVGNTHSEANVTGTSMTEAYHKAHDVIKKHVNAGPNDALLFVGFGMTAAINKLQRILGLKIPELYNFQQEPAMFLLYEGALLYLAGKDQEARSFQENLLFRQARSRSWTRGARSLHDG